MKYSILVPWRNTEDPWRAWGFREVLDEWNLIIEGLDAEICIADSSGEQFNRSAAKNNAYRQSSGTVLIFADADTLVRQRGLLPLLRAIEAGSRVWGFPYNTYYNATHHWTSLFRLHGELASLKDERGIQFEHRLTDAVGGVVVVHRKAFETIQGYDERFQGWGYEDRAFGYALTTLFGEPYRSDDYVVHLWHQAPEETRFEQPSIQHNRALAHRYEQCRMYPSAMMDLIGEHTLT